MKKFNNVRLCEKEIVFRENLNFVFYFFGFGFGFGKLNLNVFVV